jgi:hypothetical protein
MSYFRLIICSSKTVVGQGGFEPPKTNQQIYSLSHLATLVLPPISISQKRARERIRTPDLLITNQLLYQLSYSGLIKELSQFLGVQMYDYFIFCQTKNEKKT